VEDWLRVATRRREIAALAALAAILAITTGWWALALWPTPSDAPDWLLTAKTVCFGVAPNGLPDGSGWVALLLQPAIMLGMLLFIWGDATAAGLRAVAQGGWGRFSLGGLALLFCVGVGAAGVRVANAASAAGTDYSVTDGKLPDTYPRLDRVAPALALTDQLGNVVNLEQWHGRPVVVTFAFGHCKTVCPVVVHDVRQARQRLSEAAPVMLVVTLDPWRDVPSRLPTIAGLWNMSGEEYVLSGAVDEVEATLDAWNIPRSRDLATGDITHPRLVYLIDRDGKIAYATNAGVDAIVDLVTRL
jgi:cytochrome oxidase Cu insertion factor (SCO1/SenC/PrrC family)